MLIDRFAAGGRVEILDALAGPLPATVIADIIGIPPEHRALFLDWKEAVFGNPEAETSRATSERYVRIRELFGSFIAARRDQPSDDMVSNLVAAQTAGGEGLDDQTVLGLLMLFLGGGQETTGKAMTSGAAAARRTAAAAAPPACRARSIARLHRRGAAFRTAGAGHLPDRHPGHGDRRCRGA